MKQMLKKKKKNDKNSKNPSKKQVFANPDTHSYILHIYTCRGVHWLAVTLQPQEHEVCSSTSTYNKDIHQLVVSQGIQVWVSIIVRHNRMVSYKGL